MKPFKNSGWPPYQKMLDVCPHSLARGANTFSPITHAPPPPLFDDEPTDGTSGAINDTATSAATTLFNNASSSTVDNASSTVISSSAQKRKLGAEGSDISIASNRGAPTVSSTTSNHSAVDAAGSDQPKKKQRSTTAASSSVPSSRRVSNKTSDKMTPLLLAHELQGTLHQLTSAISLDPIAEMVRKASAVVQENADGLSDDDIITLLTLFTRDPATVNTYNSLYLPHIRKAWVSKTIQAEKQRERQRDVEMLQQ